MVLVVKNPSANAGDKRCGFDPWVGKSPSRRAWQSTPLDLDTTEATQHTGTQPRTTSGLIPKFISCCHCGAGQQWKAIHCSHSGTCTERIHPDTCSEREGQRTKGLLLWLWKFMHRSDTHHFCSHLIGQNKSCDHLRVLVSPLRVWMFVNGYHLLIDFNISSVSMRQWLVIFICMSLIATEVGHIFRCFLSICVYSFENCLFLSLDHFSIEFFKSDFVAYLYSLATNPLLILSSRLWHCFPLCLRILC